MRNLYRKAATLRDLLRVTNRNLRATAPQTDLNTFWEREGRNASDLRDALAVFREILEDDDRLGGALGPGMKARMGFSLSDRLCRHGMADEAEEVLKVVGAIRDSLPPDHPELEAVRVAYGLAVMSHVLVCLFHVNIPEAKRRLALLDCLGSTDTVLRQKAGAAYYLAYECLTVEQDAGYAEEIVGSFLPYRDRIREFSSDRTAEAYMRARYRDQAPEKGEPGPPTVHDFPLALGMDGHRLLMLNLPEDLPRVGMEENTAEILASMDMLLMVFWGSSGDAERARKWYGDITSWGETGSIKALQAQAAVYMVHYIGAKDPDGALAFFRSVFGESGVEPLGSGFPEEKSQAAVNLVAVMAGHGRADECLRIFRAMYERPYFHRNPLISSRTIRVVVEALASRGRIAEALAVFRLVPDFGLSMEVKVMHARAAITLIHYSGLYGTEQDAREIHDYIMSFPDQRETWPMRSRTAAAMASVYELKGNLGAALAIFRSMPSGRGSLAEDLDRAEAAHSVIRLLGSHAEGHGALDVFHSLGPWGSDCEEMDIQRAGAVVNVLLVLGKAGMLKKARELYAGMPGWGASLEMDVMHAKAAVNFVAVLEEAGEPKKAQAVYDAMGVWGDQPELCAEKAKAAVTLIGLYGRLGEPKKAQAVYDSLPQNEISPAFQELKESCLLNLLTALAMARRWTEALQAATGPAAGLLSSTKREELLKRLDILMTRTESMGGKERRKVLRFLAERLRNH
ncbi:MAG: hypothetical protein LBQ12_15925 [Deltaproteobacteria bacterium]|jgi:tetratricopeptide (TPR) repeat protein|nr:hypothetical protein [Deltaproteobacteria bacterium]